mmetsp:Transcript_18391/g.50486  ORF Transcript_18391/g.50486 Transcript_18391/m.50486 type:complete len:424 (-) Transcript_18391:74-1345(-)
MMSSALCSAPHSAVGVRCTPSSNESLEVEPLRKQARSTMTRTARATSMAFKAEALLFGAAPSRHMAAHRPAWQHPPAQSRSATSSAAGCLTMLHTAGGMPCVCTSCTAARSCSKRMRFSPATRCSCTEAHSMARCIIVAFTKQILYSFVTKVPPLDCSKEMRSWTQKVRPKGTSCKTVADSNKSIGPSMLSLTHARYVAVKRHKGGHIVRCMGMRQATSRTPQPARPPLLRSRDNHGPTSRSKAPPSPRMSTTRHPGAHSAEKRRSTSAVQSRGGAKRLDSVLVAGLSRCAKPAAENASSGPGSAVAAPCNMAPRPGGKTASPSTGLKRLGAAAPLLAAGEGMSVKGAMSGAAGRPVVNAGDALSHWSPTALSPNPHLALVIDVSNSTPPCARSRPPHCVGWCRQAAQSLTSASAGGKQQPSG